MKQSVNDQIETLLADLPPLLSAREVASLLRVSTRQVSRYVAAGRLAAIKLGGSRGHKSLFPKSAVIEFLVQHVS